MSRKQKHHKHVNVQFKDGFFAFIFPFSIFLLCTLKASLVVIITDKRPIYIHSKLP